jgi:hypothetical protein
VVRQGKGSGIRLVHKAYGGGPAKSLKTETTNTSYWLVYKVKVLDRSQSPFGGLSREPGGCMCTVLRLR